MRIFFIRVCEGAILGAMAQHPEDGELQLIGSRLLGMSSAFPCALLLKLKPALCAARIAGEQQLKEAVDNVTVSSSHYF